MSKYFLAAAAAGFIASLFGLRMGEVFAELKLPLLFPPVWLLPLGWAVTLALLAKSAGRVSGKKIKTAFFVSLSLLVIWALLFFRLNAYGGGVVSGLLLTGVWLHMRRVIGGESVTAGRQLLACCIWAGYSVYLNLGIDIIN
jgi:tryptophan-rich sensory protein